MIRTKRLILRPWKDEDFEPFAELNSDSIVREFFPKLLNKLQSDEQAKQIAENIENNGWGFWAVSIIGGSPFIGFIGLSYLKELDAIEIGWRIAYPYWGKGYATEGAFTALSYGFEILGFEEIISVTAAANERSRKVMEKLGMQHDPNEDFDMPELAEDNPIRHTVIYRLKKVEWLDQKIRLK